MNGCIKLIKYHIKKKLVWYNEWLYLIVADLNRATIELNIPTGYWFSIGVICSFFHEMSVISGMTGCEKVDSEYLNS